MDEIINLPTDDRIADILRKLKEVDAKAADKFHLDKPKEETQVTSSEDSSALLKTSSKCYEFDSVVPWLNINDKDTNSLHYLSLDDSGVIEHKSVPINKSISDIALLKLRKDYICDVDYYLSNHYVLLIDQHEVANCSDKSIINTTLAKCIQIDDTEITDDTDTVTPCSICANDKSKYYHYTIYTDLGVIEFDASQDELMYPYGESDLNHWLEETSNCTSIINPNYMEHHKSKDLNITHCDMITMHHPRVFTLDSSASDTDESLTIKVKDKYLFIPINRILKCLKFTKNLNSFISEYFEIL